MNATKRLRMKILQCNSSKFYFIAKGFEDQEMGFEISVAAGLVSLHLCDFTPHTSHVETGNYTELSGT